MLAQNIDESMGSIHNMNDGIKQHTRPVSELLCRSDIDICEYYHKMTGSLYT